MDVANDKKKVHGEEHCKCSHGHEEHCKCSHGQEEHCECGHEHGHEEHCECGHEHSHDHEEHCGCCKSEHDHAHGGCSCCEEKLKGELETPVFMGFTGDQLRDLIRILVAGVLLLLASVLPRPAFGSDVAAKIYEYALYVVPYLVIGYDVLWRAIKNISHGEIFDENFLMCIATVGALGVGELPEAVAVMLFYQIGELFQDYAVARSRRSISDLMDIRPDYANIMRDGQLVRVSPENINIGELIVVKPGEKVPLDGEITEGTSSLDTMALTGESLPRDVAAGDNVLSGCVNKTGTITVKVGSLYADSTASKIIDMVENASDRKAESENFITKFARVYTPVVVIAAALLACVPPIFAGDFVMWLTRALTFLVISCPCALVISIPLSFFGGIGGASRRGILVKGSNYLEALAKVDTVAMDKTGTLTQGTFSVTEITPVGSADADKLIETAALAEAFSTHPISISLRARYGRTIDSSRISGAQEIAGRGVRALVDGVEVFAGNAKLMAEHGFTAVAADARGTQVHVARGGEYMGCILISDALKPDARQAVTDMKASGVKNVVMLTGDSRGAAQKFAAELGITDVRAELMPGDKVAALESLIGRGEGLTAFVGDGINDAPVLKRADIGIAMGGLGSDAAIEAADIVIMDDKPSKVALATKIARKTLRIVKENIYLALGVKAIVLVLGALGMANMWAAVIADVGVMLVAVLNATRALNTRQL